MNPESQELLDLVRDAEDPRAEDERRVLAAVRVAVGATAVAGAGLSAAGIAGNASNAGNAGAGAKLATLFAGWTAPGVKFVGVAVCVIAAGGVALWPTSEVAPIDSPAMAAAAAQTAAHASAPAETPAAIEVPTPEAQAEPAHPPEPKLDAESARARPIEARGVPSQAAPSATSTATAPSLHDELALLAEVQASLKRGDGDAALRRLDAHATTDQQLLAERDAARVLALCAAGRATEARAAADAFLLGHPSSPQRTAVADACRTPKPAAPSPSAER